MSHEFPCRHQGGKKITVEPQLLYSKNYIQRIYTQLIMMHPKKCIFYCKTADTLFEKNYILESALIMANMVSICLTLAFIL